MIKKIFLKRRLYRTDIIVHLNTNGARTQVTQRVRSIDDAWKRVLLKKHGARTPRRQSAISPRLPFLGFPEKTRNGYKESVLCGLTRLRRYLYCPTFSSRA